MTKTSPAKIGFVFLLISFLLIPSVTQNISAQPQDEDDIWDEDFGDKPSVKSSGGGGSIPGTETQTIESSPDPQDRTAKIDDEYNKLSMEEGMPKMPGGTTIQQQGIVMPIFE